MPSVSFPVVLMPVVAFASVIIYLIHSPPVFVGQRADQLVLLPSPYPAVCSKAQSHSQNVTPFPRKYSQTHHQLPPPKVNPPHAELTTHAALSTFPCLISLLSIASSTLMPPKLSTPVSALSTRNQPLLPAVTVAVA